ncbi:MAG TPA: ArsR family transcriptional regulator [Chloroflexi bacterium]|nr:ArsR family transcriptional regulator [Chloroflexota bacterium]HHW87994.1 winged helix-turn-helix transcriptional regulator [Chloroflexota bacterium]
MNTADYELLSAKLKVLAHPERLRILDVLRREPECVCHLEALLGKPQPYISQQLRLLREAGVITDEKQGQNVFYHLSDAEVSAWLDVVLGPIDQSDFGANQREFIVACTCPKCAPTTVLLAA